LPPLLLVAYWVKPSTLRPNMPPTTLGILCWVLNDNPRDTFYINIKFSLTSSHLKDAIKTC
ncbi:MAG TPA: hypothetical protein VGO47_00850, partial [Chlamydiales bacterium]|nr:hypothetical protein [Chlamydiales bacterium]